ncbi:MAG: hypothetical protein WBA41_13885 [Rivularia sp. (in: cyanobacteria)]
MSNRASVEGTTLELGHGDSDRLSTRFARKTRFHQETGFKIINLR